MIPVFLLDMLIFLHTSSQSCKNCCVGISCFLHITCMQWNYCGSKAVSFWVTQKKVLLRSNLMGTLVCCMIDIHYNSILSFFNTEEIASYLFLVIPYSNEFPHQLTLSDVDTHLTCTELTFALIEILMYQFMMTLQNVQGPSCHRLFLTRIEQSLIFSSHVNNSYSW